MNKARTIFIGTSSFAVPVLEKIFDLDFLDLTAVITQPDRPAGRKQILTPPPIKQLAIKYEQLTIYQPEKIRKEYEGILAKEQPELIIVASYGQILPKKLLESPKYGALNLHVSLLPELRGAVPMQMAILQGLEKTGVTLQKMVFELDEGPIISTREIELDGNETFPYLEQMSAEMSAEILEEDLPKWIAGEIEAVEQDHSQATYCAISDIKKEKAEITFETDINHAERMIRAFIPWPVAWLKVPNGDHAGKRLKIFKAKVHKEEIVSEELRIAKQDNSLFLHLCNGTLELIEIQLEGKQKGGAEDYLYLV